MNLNTFFITFGLTIIITRTWLWFVRRHGPTIFGFRPHHYFYGLVLIVIYFFVRKIWLLAIGSALVIDELPLFFIFKGFNWPDNHWKQYHSRSSLIWAVVF